MLAFVFIYTRALDFTVCEPNFDADWPFFATRRTADKKSYTQVCEENKHKRVDIEMACL